MKEPISDVKCIHNMDYMEAFPDKFIDLAIIDPPYGIGEDGRSNRSRGTQRHAATQFTPKDWDTKPETPEYFKELFRVSKNQIIWGANHFIENLPENKNSSCWIVWDKDNGTTDFADVELAWTNFKTANRLFKFTWNGMLQGDMKNKQKRIHPTQKSIQLYKWILQKFARGGYKILDTHLGYQSSRIAAYELGFDFWGCELDPEYFQDGNERFNDHIITFNEIKTVGFAKTKLTGVASKLLF